MRGAVIFDFDGLVLDTESTDFESWSAVYADHGQVLPRDLWQSVIGTDEGGFNPLLHLQQLIGRPLAPSDVHAARRAHRDLLVAGLRPLPGVVAWIDAARARGLAVAIASSSPRVWVESHLERVGLLPAFDLLMTSDRVTRVKPDPELYQRALAELGVPAADALALEDSPHGVSAAKAAELFCVAIPGPMTRDLSFHAADLVLGSLEELSLDEALDRRDRQR